MDSGLYEMDVNEKMRTNNSHYPLEIYHLYAFQMVRVEGLEPPRLTALDPKSSVSTNFTTPAFYKRTT